MTGLLEFTKDDVPALPEGWDSPHQAPYKQILAWHQADGAEAQRLAWMGLDQALRNFATTAGLAAMTTYRDQLLAQPPAGEVYTLEALVSGEGIKCHATLWQELPAGARIFAAPMPQEQKPKPTDEGKAEWKAEPSDQEIDEIFRSPPHLKATLRNASRELLRRFGRAPAASAQPVTGDTYLCKAWGETDLPAAAIVAGLEGVRAFLIGQWLGSADATDDFGTNSLNDAIQDMQAQWALEGEAWEWSAEFEIGGVSVQKVGHAAPVPQAAGQETPSDTELVAFYDSQRWDTPQAYSRALLARYGQAPAAPMAQVGVLECHLSGTGTFWPDEDKVFALPIGDHPVFAASVDIKGAPHQTNVNDDKKESL